MRYPINTSLQLRAVLRALRKSRNLSQTDVGSILGVNQKRVARIESAPGLTSFDQIATIVNALGGRLVIDVEEPEQAQNTSRKRGARSTGASW